MAFAPKNRPRGAKTHLKAYEEALRYEAKRKALREAGLHSQVNRLSDVWTKRYNNSVGNQFTAGGKCKASSINKSLSAKGVI